MGTILRAGLILLGLVYLPWGVCALALTYFAQTAPLSTGPATAQEIADYAASCPHRPAHSITNVIFQSSNTNGTDNTLGIGR